MTQNDVDVDEDSVEEVLKFIEQTCRYYPDSNLRADLRDRLRKLYRKQSSKVMREALAGRWKDEDLVDFANMISMEGDGTKWEGQSMARLLAQFKSEMGIK